MSWRIQFTGHHCQHSLSLPTQGISVVFGSSGSGKTTFLHALAGVNPQPGTIAFGEQTWQDTDNFTAPAQRQLAMVFQEPRLLPHLDAARNIALGGHHIDAQEWQYWCDLLGIQQRLRQPAKQLSGGEQQRVALARALLKPSQALLLDEPFNGLDRQRRNALLPALKQLSAHKPIVLVTHQLDELLALADHLVLMDEQSSVSGNLESLLNHPLITRQRGHVYSILRGQRLPDSQYQGLQAFALEDGLSLRIAATPEASTPFIAIDARDVSLTLSRATDSSIVNILATTIAHIEAPVQGIQQVKLKLGQQSLTAQLSSYSVAHLRLEAGMNVFAQIKGSAFVGR